MIEDPSESRSDASEKNPLRPEESPLRQDPLPLEPSGKTAEPIDDELELAPKEPLPLPEVFEPLSDDAVLAAEEETDDPDRDDWMPYVSEPEPVLQFSIATIMMITAATACLFAIERFFSSGTPISLVAVLLGVISPIAAAYFVAADRRMAVNMLVCLYFAAFFCRFTGWNALHTISFLFAVMLTVYTSGVRLGAAVRFDLHAPLVGVPITALMIFLLIFGHFSEYGHFNPLTFITTVIACLAFAVTTVFRLLGLN